MAEEPQADAGDEPGSEADSRSLYTVFAGSSQEDVAYAKVFWSSLSLQPPLESRLVSGDIKQRLKVAPPAGSKPCKEQCCHCQPSQADIKSKQLLIEAHMQLKADEKERYLEKWMEVNTLSAGQCDSPACKYVNLWNGLGGCVDSWSSWFGSDRLKKHANAKKRKEILELIKKQREERLQKEQLALPYKPKKIMQVLPKPARPDFSNEAQETYQALRQFD